MDNIKVTLNSYHVYHKKLTIKTLEKDFKYKVNN